jgi:hypothetical protein
MTWGSASPGHSNYIVEYPARLSTCTIHVPGAQPSLPPRATAWEGSCSTKQSPRKGARATMNVRAEEHTPGCFASPGPCNRIIKQRETVGNRQCYPGVPAFILVEATFPGESREFYRKAKK